MPTSICNLTVADLDSSPPALLSVFDDAMREFMLLRDIPGGALAVSLAGRLLLGRGYTLHEDASGPILPTSLFRIASVSKPLAAAATLRLVQEGKLKLSDSVYDILGLRPHGARVDDRDPRRITVLHLLQHQGGWDRSVSFDPHSVDRAIAGRFGKHLPISREDIVAFVTEHPLDFAPGTRYAYSNYGYQLMGHIVEKLSGMEYTAFVKKEILAALGITRPRQGRTLAEYRAEGEVVYHSSNPNVFGNVMLPDGGNDAPVAYGGYNLENMVTSGGWISSPVDLVRFASALGSPAACPFLDASHLDLMFAPPAANAWPDGAYYACGWVVRPSSAGIDASHSGCLQGVAATLRRRPDGVVFCALFNRREETTPFSWDIDPALNAAIDGIAGGSWPDVDLFETAGIPTA